MILQTTLSLAAAAAMINLWLAIRIGRLRAAEKILHGDGGNPALMRRMRAQANFIEYTPIVLILIAAIEMTGKGGTWLAIVGSLYMLGRVLHGFGMDNPGPNPWRMIGVMATMLVMLGLAVVAVLIALGRI
ncbi:MAPEG family protein [Novosphingobium album (ex Liu et al. 2023)]|uniref:MAPEG family protein n=1 Tax=Novosphingobium album (ex Liu et al. 2023) TaxID=3031130 RepID=A0ABT5WW35_9SPHN|nr:MAPEG family protein [Novosphingobium album (ex Liu et al. 2023)]MDE8654121.1 MAPEG family protein [Novosphingobium album (ex Liu et al. 2023)]